MLSKKQHHAVAMVILFGTYVNMNNIYHKISLQTMPNVLNAQYPSWEETF